MPKRADKPVSAGRQCQQFYCDHRRGRFCCADCPSPCSNPCLNSPDRCGLVLSNPTTPSPRSHKYRAIDPEAALRLYNQGLTDAEIAERLGAAKSSIQRWRKNEGIGSHRERRNT